MIIDIKDAITLDDNNTYVVVSKVEYEGKSYFYLLDEKDNTNLKFCYQDNDELVELNDKELTTKLLPLFYEAAKNEFEKIKTEKE